MRLDPDYLRKHYASLSDEALLALDRADLVEAAQVILDEEVQRRQLVLGPRRTQTPSQSDRASDETEVDGDQRDDGDGPDWLQDAAEMYSVADLPGMVSAPGIANARDVLESAGKPCHLDLYEEPQRQDTSPLPTHRWRLMVPGTSKSSRTMSFVR